MNAFERFDDDDDPSFSQSTSVLDSQNFIEKMNGISIWKIVTMFLIALVGILLAAGIVCGTNDQCRNHIPTVQNMLNSHLAGPFITTAINIMQLIHIILSLSVFYMCKDKAQHWSILQILVASLFHFALLLTLFLVTFLGWDRNWSNVVALIVWMLWMLLVMKCLKKYHKYRVQRVEVSLLKWNWVCLLLYSISVVVYIVFRAISPDKLDFKGKDGVILSSEILGGLAGIVFIVLLVFHTRKVLFNMHAPK
jgi:hypothetical protein